MRRENRPLLLEAGLEAHALAAPAREQEFAAARVLSLEDIARIYGVPLSVVGFGKNSSYGSLTDESRALRQNCISPGPGASRRSLRTPSRRLTDGAT